jgi:hypothetical protein
VGKRVVMGPSLRIRIGLAFGRILATSDIGDRGAVLHERFQDVARLDIAIDGLGCPAVYVTLNGPRR